MYKRKKILFGIVCFMLMFSVSAFAGVNSAGAVDSFLSRIIYETKSIETITQGVTLEKVVRFTDNGWLNINVMRVDLTNPYIVLDTLINGQEISKTETVRDLAAGENAVAAINGGFFNGMSIPGYAYPDGLAIKSGTLLTASTEFNLYNDSMATFSMGFNGQISFDYWKTEVRILKVDGTVFPVNGFNKESTHQYCDITVLNRKWGPMSPGNTRYPDMTEVVVDKGVVVEIRTGMPPIEIPEKGFVILSRQDGAQRLTSSLSYGDTVSLDIKTSPDWKNIKTALSGSAILVKDGKIPAQFSFNIDGRHPRTAIGSTEDGKQLILVAVDGRQNMSIGLTQTEMAALMIELGAFNAINMDGGGSTTMVARTPGGNELEVTNSPSGGFERKISTALGVFSTAPMSSLAGVVIKSRDSNIFAGTSRHFTASGYDEFFNPVEIDQSQVQWSVEGVEGLFENGIFIPTTAGTGIIRAQIGEVTGEYPIKVLNSPSQLSLNEYFLRMKPGSSIQLVIDGKDQDGFHAYIAPEDVTWTVHSNIGTIQDGLFTATGQGMGYIQASLGDLTVNCAVSVESDTFKYLDDFEKPNATFLSYPSGLEGGYEISTEQSHSGKSSGKLTFDFSSSIRGTRCAYVYFSQNGIPLEPDTKTIGLWVYNVRPNDSWLRAMVRDASGTIHYITFAERLNDFIGWKYVEASLEDVSNPAYLERIYLAQINDIPDMGSIYIDDLSISSGVSSESISIPVNMVVEDKDRKSVDYIPGENSFRFSVFGISREPSSLLERLLQKSYLDRINKYLEATAAVGNVPEDLKSKLVIPIIATTKGWQSHDIFDSRFIQLDVSKNGIRATEPMQWHWFLDQLETAPGKNIFIFMHSSLDSFSDKYEADLFQQILTDYIVNRGKRIWVFQKGSNNFSYNESGVKYLFTAGLDQEGIAPDNTDNAEFILVTVQEDEVYYEIKPIIY
jgi:exopolysaccharide biosynthesis protein